MDTGTGPGGEQVIILQSEYDQLKEDVKFMRALEAAGVDNWDGYSYALELLREGELDGQ